MTLRVVHARRSEAADHVRGFHHSAPNQPTLPFIGEPHQLPAYPDNGAPHRHD